MEKRSFPIRKKENKWKAHLLDADDKTLENARLLEENQRLRQLVEERIAELAMINSVQEGLASKMDVQAIYDLVGDKIREVFHAQGTAIYLFDHKTETLDTPYCYLKKRFEIEARPFSEHPIARSMVNTLQPITYRTVEEYRALGGAVLENSEEYKSGMYVPLMVGKEIKGMVGIANLDEENAYHDSDLRLLQTLANSMSVALENARLFDETQRLLKETEQRNAELAIINSVQHGLAAELDFQALVDMVGDKLRQVFGNSDVTIGIYDPKTDFGSVPYIVENGQRLHIEPFKIEGRGFTGEMIRNPRTILINQNLAHEMEKIGSHVLPGTNLAKSMLDVPLVVGGVLRGKLQLQDMHKESAFTDSDVRLLETIASSMSVALENARLFDETQRLLKETEEHNAELAIITSVQRALASKLEMQAIYDLVGDKVRDVFDAQGVGISYYDRATNFIRFPYCLFRGKRITEMDFELGKGLTSHIIQSRQPLLINEDAAERYKELGAIFAATESEDTAKSWLGVPLIAGGQVTGVIQLENYEREFAYSDSDVRLLTTLANSMSVALENARLFDEVQKKNAEITEALERETASNDILRVIAESPTDIQPVLDVIARNATQLSGLDDAIITLRAGDMLRVDAHYGDVPTFPIGEGFPFNRDSVAGRAILEGRPLQAIHNQRGVKSEYPEGDKAARKYGYRMSCAVPLMREGKAIGAISIRRLNPELLTEKQIALIQPFANQAAIAVENVRLFNETTRLLKETEQRNAELAIINSVQAGLASKLDIQAIYDLVGDKLSEIFDAPAVFISNYDLAANRAYYPYYSIERKRISLEPRPPSGAALEIIRTRQPVFLQQDAEKRLVEEYKMPTIPGTPDAESYLLMPMIVGSHVKGGIGVMSTDRKHPLDDSSVRLLQTIASSMSVALENARLFDETQRLFLEAKEARSAAEQADQAKSAFLSSMSHELRTPLNAIINFVEMIARGMIGPVNQEQVELLDQALHSSKHLLNLINDVLDISKIQAGQLTLFIEDQVSVQVELEATLSIVGGLLQEKGLQLIRDIDSHLPMISCDRRRVRQVLLNLISNAVKFTNEGTVTVSVKNQGQAVLFAVIDTGPGIPLAKQNLIFEPFLQAENSERQVQGTGLGLPISRSLVRAHGGELWVDSQPGEGSAFFFTLPVVRRRTL